MEDTQRPLSDADILRITTRVLELFFTHPLIMGGKDRLIVGEDVNLGNAIVNTRCGTVTVGDGTFCGTGVSILTGSHELTGDRERSPDGRDIVIGKMVWLASNCTVLGPCTIGDRAVIAAGAVVTKDCEAGWIYGGVPAKKIRKAV